MDGFESRNGGFSVSDVGRTLAPFYSNHWLAVSIAIVIMIVLIIAFFFGWIGASSVKKQEKVSVLTKIVRDGAGESLASGALETGYSADPTTFCASAGEPTNDPHSYMLDQLNESVEGFRPYPGYQTQLDGVLARAMQH